LRPEARFWLFVFRFFEFVSSFDIRISDFRVVGKWVINRAFFQNNKLPFIETEFIKRGAGVFAMPLFETYMFVDWSARNALTSKNPSKDSIWVGEFSLDSNELTENYFRGRCECFDSIVDRLSYHFKRNHRILLGFDFAYGYPQGLASALYLPTGTRAAWWNIWTEISSRVKDDEKNTNNRFIAASDLNGIVGSGDGGPFWGVPKGQATDDLHSNSPGFPFRAQNGVDLKRLRLAEIRLPQVQETWKLYGTGSVGGQSLVGIPYLLRLRRSVDFVQRSAVWPFETNFIATPTPPTGPFIIHAEIWPGVVKEAVASIAENQPAAIRDQIQVRAMCQWAADLDLRNELGRSFDMPEGLEKRQIKTCIEQEGWILGAL